jgi:N6-L-threonylcarbamoyladenine synthase
VIKKYAKVLAIETSCDDTSVAIVNEDGFVDIVLSANQDLAHAPYGGIVPEIASRNHTIHLIPLIHLAFERSNLSWNEIDGIVVTNRPGLIGSLIVGIVTAKTLAHVHQKDLIGVNHLEGHLLAPFLSDKDYKPPVKLSTPYLAIAVSGGHTSLYRVESLGKYHVLGSTRDDAAGEAYDKFAKMLGLGFPGGVKVDQLAQAGNPRAFDFPRSMLKEETYDMSFSGLKASAQRLISTLTADEITQKKNDLCASFQAAVVDVLIGKLDRAAKNLNLRQAIITGGVSANSLLRARGLAWAQENKIDLVIPPLRYCTDNAAMIGFAGIQRLNLGESHGLDLGPSPQPWVDDVIDERQAFR